MKEKIAMFLLVLIIVGLALLPQLGMPFIRDFMHGFTVTREELLHMMGYHTARLLIVISAIFLLIGAVVIYVIMKRKNKI